jgi:riboflavin synthase
MFTGLVQAVGHLHRSPDGVRIQGGAGWERAVGLRQMALGDSIAVDGVCLTVAEVLGDGFRADVSAETLQRSTLAAKAAAGEWVNLEPALRLQDRLGGHLVSGHVDGIGTIEAIERQPESWRLVLRWRDERFGRYICEKASIAVDGISLTVAGCDPEGVTFWIAVIPHTWASTTLQRRRVGDAVNLEADLLAKYTERLLQGARSTASGEMGKAGGAAAAAPITTAWLAERGWGSG